MQNDLENILNTAEATSEVDPIRSLLFYKKYIKESSTQNNNTKNITPIVITDKIINIINTNISTIKTNTIYSDYEIKQIFELIKLGDIKKFKELYNKYNDFKYYSNGLTPLHETINNGDSNFAKLLLNLGAKINITSSKGLTVFEFAFIKEDPNMMEFLIEYGVDVRKTNKLRSYKNIVNHTMEIDVALLYSYIMVDNSLNNSIYIIKHMNWVFKYLNKDDDIVEIKYVDSDITIPDVISHIDNIVNNLQCPETYLLIIKEELDYTLLKTIACPANRLYILLYNLVPFIDYKEPIIMQWLVILEIQYNIQNTFNKYPLDFKINLKKKLIESYSNILTKNYIQVLLNIIFSNKI